VGQPNAIERVVQAERVASAEKAKLEEAVTILRSSGYLKSEIPSIDGASIELSDRMAILHFHCLSDLWKAIDFIEACDWICKAVRRPAADGKYISTSSYEFVFRENERAKTSLQISCYLGSSRSSEMTFSCWETLFQSCTLVVSSLKPRLAFGKGLELSFELMISLAAAEFHLIVGGGVVFIGYRTVLFPTAVHDNCAQFHLLTTNDGQINPYTLKYESRMLTEDVTQFKKNALLPWMVF